MASLICHFSLSSSQLAMATTTHKLPSLYCGRYATTLDQPCPYIHSALGIVCVLRPRYSANPIWLPYPRTALSAYCTQHFFHPHPCSGVAVDPIAATHRIHHCNRPRQRRRRPLSCQDPRWRTACASAESQSVCCASVWLKHQFVATISRVSEQQLFSRVQVNVVSFCLVLPRC